MNKSINYYLFKNLMMDYRKTPSHIEKTNNFADYVTCPPYTHTHTYVIQPAQP